MTFFSRCDTSHRPEASHRSSNKRRSRLGNEVGPLAAIAGFAEDIGILFRYAAGLDYYGRNRLMPRD